MLTTCGNCTDDVAGFRGRGDERDARRKLKAFRWSLGGNFFGEGLGKG